MVSGNNSPAGCGVNDKAMVNDGALVNDGFWHVENHRHPDLLENSCNRKAGFLWQLFTELKLQRVWGSKPSINAQTPCFGNLHFFQIEFNLLSKFSLVRSLHLFEKHPRHTKSSRPDTADLLNKWSTDGNELHNCLQVTSSITGLSQSTSSYKIHGLPVNSQGSGVTQCQTSAVGGVFNPYSASSTPSTGGLVVRSLFVFIHFCSETGIDFNGSECR